MIPEIRLDEIPIEERSPDEVGYMWGRDAEGTARQIRVAAPEAPCWNPAFDVTPAALVAGLSTECGIVDASPEALTAVASTPKADEAM